MRRSQRRNRLIMRLQKLFAIRSPIQRRRSASRMELHIANPYKPKQRLQVRFDKVQRLHPGSRTIRSARRHQERRLFARQQALRRAIDIRKRLPHPHHLVQVKL